MLLEYTREQINKKLKNALRIFRTSENNDIIDQMINETLDEIGFNIIAESSMKKLRQSFFQQNFSCWKNVLKLDWHKKYF